MSARFHLAIEVGCLISAIDWYKNIIGCETGDYEEGIWVDVNFWDNELTLHASDPNKKPLQIAHPTDMKDVSVPHFGVHMPWDAFQGLSLRATDFIIAGPYHRFKGKPREQKTMFIQDPHGNVLEMKTMLNPETLWSQ